MLLDTELLKKTGVFALVSGELIACIGIGVLLGKWIDQKLHTAPVFTSALATIGLVYSVWRVKQVSRTWLEKPDSKNDGK